MHPILQFGTSRFLQAHVDLFISDALARGEALGQVTVVQTTGNAASERRVAGFNQPGGYPVRIRGRQDGEVIDVERRVSSVGRALSAAHDWPEVVAQAASDARVIVSNTGDRGYDLAPEDHAGLLGTATAPRSFPAKLLVLLHARYLAGAAPITILPCELVVNNGLVLREVVLKLARAWQLDQDCLQYLATQCLWVNSLVDRIVSEAIEPVGAVAEPYAIWVIEAQAGMQLPCSHPQIVITDRLQPFEQRKLFLLNLGHTFLAQRWLQDQRPGGETVFQAMSDPVLRAELDALWEDEVLPVFAALGDETQARAYVAQVRERFDNPFLAHRLADIAQNHEEKKQRRLQPVVALAQEHGLAVPQRRLRAALGLEAA